MKLRNNGPDSSPDFFFFFLADRICQFLGLVCFFSAFSLEPATGIGISFRTMIIT